jgi:hypothetical protein
MAGAQVNIFTLCTSTVVLTFLIVLFTKILRSVLLENEFTTRGAFAHFEIPTAEGGLEKTSANSRSVSCSEALKLRLTLLAVLHHTNAKKWLKKKYSSAPGKKREPLDRLARRRRIIPPDDPELSCNMDDPI